MTALIMPACPPVRLCPPFRLSPLLEKRRLLRRPSPTTSPCLPASPPDFSFVPFSGLEQHWKRTDFDNHFHVICLLAPSFIHSFRNASLVRRPTASHTPSLGSGTSRTCNPSSHFSLVSTISFLSFHPVISVALCRSRPVSLASRPHLGCASLQSLTSCLSWQDPPPGPARICCLAYGRS